MEIFIVLLIIVVIVSFMIFVIDWSVHVNMVKDQHRLYDWCTFKTFIKEFDKYKNHPDLYTEKWGDTSIFLRGPDWEDIVYLHASIIKFNGKCMILYPHSWLQYCIWKRNFCKTKKPKYKQKGLWK